MKNVKNLLVGTLVLFALTVTSSAFVTNATNEKTVDMIFVTAQAQESFALAPEELQQDIMADTELRAAAVYAYMDVDTAPKILEPVILQSRGKIIFSESWTVHGKTFTVRANGTVEHDPEFSYLFPTWDIPKAEPSKVEADGFVTLAATKNILNYKIPKAGSSNASAMTKVKSTTDELLYTKVTALIPSSCNIGYSHAGYSLGSKTNLRVGDYYHIYPDAGSTYEIRTSTYGTSAAGSFSIIY